MSLNESKWKKGSTNNGVTKYRPGEKLANADGLSWWVKQTTLTKETRTTRTIHGRFIIESQNLMHLMPDVMTTDELSILDATAGRLHEGHHEGHPGMKQIAKGPIEGRIAYYDRRSFQMDWGRIVRTTSKEARFGLPELIVSGIRWKERNQTQNYSPLPPTG